MEGFFRQIEGPFKPMKGPGPSKAENGSPGKHKALSGRRTSLLGRAYFKNISLGWQDARGAPGSAPMAPNVTFSLSTPTEDQITNELQIFHVSFP